MLTTRGRARTAAMATALMLLASTRLLAQDVPRPAPSTASEQTPSVEALMSEIRRLQQAIETLQTQLTESQRQTAAVQESLQALRAQLEEERELVASQLAGLEQTKVESGSKYRVRVFGMALMQLVSARGAVDNVDLPLLAIESPPGDSGGSLMAAVRQSFVGLAVFGPRVAGMDTSADLRLDFFGGFPAVNDGLSAVGLRLRTMSMAAEGQSLSIRAGQEAPFFSPLSPVSLASTAYPALSASGNIWAWTPQLYVERRFMRSEDTTITLRTGVLDALTGELPAGEYSRLSTAGERSRLPAPAARVGWRHTRDAQVTSVGAGVYYSRHNWGFDRIVNAWALTGDWEVPVSDRVTISGELYGGQAIGGLGGGAHASVLFDGTPSDPSAIVYPLHSVGGWAQAKWRLTPRLDLHAAFGADRSKPRPAPVLLTPPYNEVPSATRNASGFANAILQMRSNLFFTAEYKRLWTRRFDGRAWLADHVSLGGAIVF